MTREDITFLPGLPYAAVLRYECEENTRPAVVHFRLCLAVAEADGPKLRCKRGTRGEPFGVSDPAEAQVDASGFVKFDGCANVDATAHTCDGMQGFNAFAAALTEAVRLCDVLLEAP
jgi:hypothetical protein